MNRTKVLAGLAAIASLFSFSSCISVDYSLGSAYVPSNQYIEIEVAEIDLPICQQMADSIQTSISSTATFGIIRSEEYGEFSAKAIFSITPAYDSTILGDNPVFKDAYATIALSKAQYLEDDQERIPQNIHVYQLNKEIDSSMIYSCSITRDDYDKTPVTFENTIYTGGETFDIHFTDEFAKPILDMTFEQLDSTELFVKSFYGIVVETDDLEEGAIGGRLNILDLSDSYMYLTYTSTNYEGRRRDTTLTFCLGSYFALSAYNSGSGKLIDEGDPRKSIYMESLSGIKPVVPAGELKNAIESWAVDNGIDLSSLLVAKAALTFPFEYTGNADDYSNWPGSLYPCRRVLDTAGRYWYTALDELDESEMDHGSANYSLFQFRSDAALYVQDLIRTDYEDLTLEDDLWMIPTVEYTTTTTTSNPYSSYYSPYSSYYGSYYSSYYSSYYGYSSSYSTTTTTYNYPDIYYYSQCALNGTEAERHPTLRLTYTLIH